MASLGTASTNPNIPVSQIDNSKAQRFEGVASQSVTFGTVGTTGWDKISAIGQSEQLSGLPPERCGWFLRQIGGARFASNEIALFLIRTVRF